MRYFPMFLETRGRHVVLLGGGEQMAQKLRLLARTEARISIVALDLIPELAEAVAADRAAHVAKPAAPSKVTTSARVVQATVQLWEATRSTPPDTTSRRAPVPSARNAAARGMRGSTRSAANAPGMAAETIGVAASVTGTPT
ncbi:MAG: NAD(P)-dependent oxidoreductase, partial [Pseudomonadota bacterium]